MRAATRVVRAAALVAVVTAVWGARPAAAQTSWGLGVLPSGALLFCDRVRETVWRINPDGSRDAAVTGVTCHALVSGPDGAVYGEHTPGDVTEARGVALWRILSTGVREWVVTPTFDPPPGLWLARDEHATFGWDGRGAGSERSAIIRRDQFDSVTTVSGNHRGQRDGNALDASYDNVTGISRAPDDTLVVVDSGNIRRVAADGSVHTEASHVVTDSHRGLTSLPGLWGREEGVATDRDGNAVVVDAAAGRIVHISRTGTVTPIWEPAGWPQRLSGGRWGWRPAGVAMMGTTYYVVDEWMGPALLGGLIGSPRVSQVDRAGHVTRIAAVSDWIVRGALGAFLLIVVSLVASRRQR